MYTWFCTLHVLYIVVLKHHIMEGNWQQGWPIPEYTELKAYYDGTNNERVEFNELKRAQGEDNNELKRAQGEDIVGKPGVVTVVNKVGNASSVISVRQN